jgi:hypothetical protein
MINAFIVSSLHFGASTKSNLTSPSPYEQQVANHLAEFLHSIVNCDLFSV